ncbi:MAG: hypothetical protein WD009_07325 [Phycisphaeraceae bacterium]
MDASKAHPRMTCSRCGGHEFTSWDWRHPLVLHWLLNPGLVVNELLLGQRQPRVVLVCRSCDAPLGDRTYVPCPNCNTLIDGRRWSKRAGFGHWFGLVCPFCNGIIRSAEKTQAGGQAFKGLRSHREGAKAAKLRRSNKLGERVAMPTPFAFSSLRALRLLRPFAVNQQTASLKPSACGFFAMRIIPCLWNIWSLLILAITLPVWYLPSRILRPRWLAFERRRLAVTADRPLLSAARIPWLRLGMIGWGGLMWLLFSAIVMTRAVSEGDWVLLWLVPLMIPLWAAGGALWGFLMRLLMNRRPRRT